MEGFQNGKKLAGPENNIYAEANKELKNVMREMTGLNLDSKKQVFDRMLLGEEVVSEDPELIALFEQIANVEEKYGRERVAELSAFYVRPELADND